jgi:hypothetical protein
MFALTTFYKSFPPKTDEYKGGLRIAFFVSLGVKFVQHSSKEPKSGRKASGCQGSTNHVRRNVSGAESEHDINDDLSSDDGYNVPQARRQYVQNEG